MISAGCVRAEPLHSSLHRCPTGAACARQGISARLHEAGEPCHQHPAPGRRRGSCTSPPGARELEANAHLVLDHLPYASHTDASARSSTQGEERTFAPRHPAPRASLPAPSPAGLVPLRKQGAKTCRHGACVHTPAATAPSPASEVPPWGSSQSHLRPRQPCPLDAAPDRCGCIPAASATARGQISPLHPQGNICPKPWVGAGSRSCSPEKPQPLPTPRPSQRSAPARERCRWTTTWPPGTDAAGNDNQTMPVSAGKSPARKPQRFVPSVPRQWQVPRAAAPLHFAKAPQSPPRAAGLLDRLSRSKPARATERSRSRTAGRAQPRPPHAGSPGSPARETAVSGAANNNKPACERQREKLSEETIFSSTLPQRVL